MPPYSLRRLLWAGPIATIAAVLVNLLYYTLTKALGEHYRMPLDGSTSNLAPMPFLMPVLATLVAGLMATLLFGLLIRFPAVRPSFPVRVRGRSDPLLRRAVLSAGRKLANENPPKWDELDRDSDHYGWNSVLKP